jgi:hypothetical protein
MSEPSPRSTRLAFAGGLLAVLLVGAGGFLLGRSTSVQRSPGVAPAPAAMTNPEPAVRPSGGEARVLDRGDLIALASAAADATAAGRSSPAGLSAALGRRFEVRLPFGCEGPVGAESDAPMRWHYDAADEVLRIHVATSAWQPEQWWPVAELPAVEAIEGFWIARPWTSSETCPPSTGEPTAGVSEPSRPPAQTLAIAQFLTADNPRQGRRTGEPFEVVARLAPEEVVPWRGYRLRLSGRIARVPGGGPVLCRQPAGSEQRPLCIIAVAAHDLAVENPATGTTLATWSLDGSDAANR